ncbi:MAG: S24/S26 family peptidase [Acutalibacteraceae bacterium]|nr:S24/S26 family peptidase [Acutalibacteraceae bacterium]
MTDNKVLSVSIRELMPVIMEQIENGQTVSLKIKGISMQPYLMNNKDTIFMVSPKDHTPKIGDLYMFRRQDGSYAMHRLSRINSDGTYDFVGDNQYLHDCNLTKDQFVAYVPKAIRNGKEISCEKGLLRFYMTKRMIFRREHPKTAQSLSKVKMYISLFIHNPTKIFGWLRKRIRRKENEEKGKTSS